MWIGSCKLPHRIKSQVNYSCRAPHTPPSPPPQVCSYALGNSSLILFSHLSVESMLFVCVMMRHISMKLLMPFCRS